MKPAIIVVTFNRPESLKRILMSLYNAKYSTKDIPLIISVDYQDSVDHDEILSIANNFHWKYGNKEIVEHKTNLGLRRHILSCGDMSEKYGSVIVLEDDLYVSPYFYNYTIDAQSFYKLDENIGGISLYNHKVNFNVRIPFEPLPSKSDVYFLKIASSWGQSWTFTQWKKFRIWYNEINSTLDFEKVPKYVKGWPESSWLKFFIAYLEEKNLYFVYPKISLTTNFSDAGTHNKSKNTDFQVPLLIEKKDYFFEKLEKSINRYDSFFEILPEIIEKFDSNFSNKCFTVDLYGTKELSKVSTKYLLSSKKLKSTDNVLLKIGLDLKPFTMNVLMGVKGGFFNLSETKSFSENKQIEMINIDVFNYFFQKLSFKTFLKVCIDKIKNYLAKRGLVF
jgi:hypothetical protein